MSISKERLAKLIREMDEFAVTDVAHVEEKTVLLTALRELAALREGAQWQPIETAPRDGTEVLGWRDDCGTILIRWTSPSELLSEQEIERSELDEESLFLEGWFWADFVQGGYRLEGSETPTHWHPLPPFSPGAAHE